jgi:hypothetical protein
MIEDLAGKESYFEMRGATSEVPEILLAVRLDKQRADFWSDSISKILATWTAINPVPVKDGWNLRKHLVPNQVVCRESGGWLLFGWGTDTVKLLPVFENRIKQAGTPADSLNGAWLDAEVDWATLLASHSLKMPLVSPYPAPKMKFILEGTNGLVRPEIVLQYAQSLNLNLEDWVLPTNVIRGPLSSFTVIRGIKSLLGAQPFLQSLKLPVIPNQATLWARSGIFVEMNAAFPMPGSSNILGQIQPTLVDQINTDILKNSALAKAAYTHNAITIPNFPVLAFYLRSVSLPQSDFLFSGCFPMKFNPIASTMSDQMMEQIYSNSKLIAYDWEVTADRFLQCRTLSSVMDLIHQHAGPTPESAGMKWVESIHTNFYNCITVATLESPSKIRILRNGSIGLTAGELSMLEHWIDSPSFPLGDQYPVTKVQPKRRGILPGVPAAPGMPVGDRKAAAGTNAIPVQPGTSANPGK